MTPPKAPNGLEKAGAALWQSLTGAYDLEPWEATVLESACRQADDVARLEVVIARDGMVSTGSAGQPRLAQAVTEVRQGRLALARLLDTLRLPAEDEAAGRTGRQVRAQRAARARWGSGGNA